MAFLAPKVCINAQCTVVNTIVRCNGVRITVPSSGKSGRCIFTARYQHISVKHLSFVPRISYIYRGIVRMSHNGEQICILQLKSITASTLSGFVPCKEVKMVIIVIAINRYLFIRIIS